MRELREILLATVIVIGMAVFGMFFYGLVQVGEACRGGDDGTVVGEWCR
jgi:hypothetical protein